MSLFCRNLWTKCLASRTDNYEDSSRNESKSNGFMFRENWNSWAVSYIYYKQTTTFRAIPVQTEHSYQTCRPLRTHCSGSVDTSELEHKHTKLIIMTFWFFNQRTKCTMDETTRVFQKVSCIICLYGVTSSFKHLLLQLYCERSHK